MGKGRRERRQQRDCVQEMAGGVLTLLHGEGEDEG